MSIIILIKIAQPLATGRSPDYQDLMPESTVGLVLIRLSLKIIKNIPLC
jgi:hypothetical protein